MAKIYKEPNKCETETTVNVLYGENILSIYSCNVTVQRKLNKIIGKPTYEHIRGRSVISSRWDIPLDDKTKISRMILKANIFEI